MAEIVSGDDRKRMHQGPLSSTRFARCTSSGKGDQAPVGTTPFFQSWSSRNFQKTTVGCFALRLGRVGGFYELLAATGAPLRWFVLDLDAVRRRVDDRAHVHDANRALIVVLISAKALRGTMGLPEVGIDGQPESVSELERNRQTAVDVKSERLSDFSGGRTLHGGLGRGREIGAARASH